jgi:hypothetical protein
MRTTMKKAAQRIDFPSPLLPAAPHNPERRNMR